MNGKPAGPAGGHFKQNHHMNPKYLHLEPAPDDAPGAVPRVHVWLNWSPNLVAREHAWGMFGPASISWYIPYSGTSEAEEREWFEITINRDIARPSLQAPVVLFAGQISALRPAARELLRRFIREADAPGAPWPPVERRRVHVIVDGTRAELEELLGETTTASETR